MNDLVRRSDVLAVINAVEWMYANSGTRYSGIYIKATQKVAKRVKEMPAVKRCKRTVNANE